MPVTLCVFLTAVPGNEQDLIDYEDQVLALLDAYGARVLQRVRAVPGEVAPFEVQVLQFPSDEALDQYMEDPVRVSLAGLRERAIASTQILRVENVDPG